MSPSLIRRLSRIAVEKPKKPPRSGETLRWLIETGAVIETSRGFEFKADAHALVERVLLSQGIKPHEVTTLDPNALRSETRQVASNEKLSRSSIGKNRVLVRAAPGRRLLLAEDIKLPTSSSLDIAVNDLLSSSRHTLVMLVENRECFDLLERLSFQPTIYAHNPLIVFRGSPGVSAGCGSFLERAGLPVWIFGDYDPAGVAIAAKVPHSVGVIIPPTDLLEAEIQRAPNHDRFQQQLPESNWAAADERDWVKTLWNSIQRAQCAIPQESFLNPERKA